MLQIIDSRCIPYCFSSTVAFLVTLTGFKVYLFIQLTADYANRVLNEQRVIFFWSTLKKAGTHSRRVKLYSTRFLDTYGPTMGVFPKQTSVIDRNSMEF